MRVMVEHVAKDEGRAFLPGNAAERFHVGLQGEVAIAALPGGRLVARHRLHIDVEGEQIVTGVRLLVRAAAEEGRVEALAREPPLQIGEAGDDGVDFAGFGEGCELVEGQHAGHGEVPC